MRSKKSSVATLLAYTWLSIAGTGLWGYGALADGIERRRPPPRPPVEATAPDVPALLGGPETQTAEAPPPPVEEPSVPTVIPVEAVCLTRDEAIALIERVAALNDIHRAQRVLREELHDKEWCPDAREEIEKAITIVNIVQLPPPTTPHDPNRPFVPDPPPPEPPGEPPGGPGGPGYRET